MTKPAHPALEALRNLDHHFQGESPGIAAAIPALEALLAERDRLFQENRDFRTGPSFSRLVRERDELRELLAGIVATAQGDRELHLHQMRFRIRKALQMSKPRKHGGQS